MQHRRGRLFDHAHLRADGSNIAAVDPGPGRRAAASVVITVE